MDKGLTTALLWVALAILTTVQVFSVLEIQRLRKVVLENQEQAQRTEFMLDLPFLKLNPR